MFNCRIGIFETNSSSCSSFSHKTDCDVIGTMSFILKVKYEVTEENENILRTMFVKWLNHKFTSNAQIIDMKLVNNDGSDIKTYFINVKGNYAMQIVVYVREFFKTHGESEPDEYFVNSFCTYITKNKDNLTKLFDEYVINQHSDLRINVIELTKDKSNFSQDDLDAHIWDDENDDDDFNPYDPYDPYD